jgi:predicted alpha/beta superfamily hydrolase
VIRGQLVRLLAKEAALDSVPRAILGISLGVLVVICLLLILRSWNTDGRP